MLEELDFKPFDPGLVIIRRMEERHVEEVARVGMRCFSGLREYWKALRWIECNFRAFPRMQYFVAEYGGKVIGYILWVEKGGFRDEAVLELEQIAVLPPFRENGVGTRLIRESFEAMRAYLKERGSVLKLVEVTTGVANKAQDLYSKTLGAVQECVIKDLYRGDEALMVARFIGRGSKTA